ncbi:MAG: hypothetical protein WBG70_21595 [Spirulinaceae cyanobacterium]
MKKIFARIILFFYTVGLGILFTFNALRKKARATHKYGVGGAGIAKIIDHPQFPEHEFFQAGRVFPLRLRHATVTYPDEAAKDIRSVSLKFSDHEKESPLDIVMNTAPQTFRHIVGFWRFALSSILKKKPDEPVSSLGLKEYCNYDSHQRLIFTTALRRAPESFTQVYYHSQLVNYFKAEDGKIRYVKYRLIPENRGKESGLQSEEDAQTPWLQKRYPQEKKRQDYLSLEYIERASKEPIIYHLQLRLHEDTGDVKEICRQDRPWSEETSPWLDLATVTIQRPLTFQETEKLTFNIGTQPPSLGIVDGKSIYDPNSINYARTRVYGFSQAVRYIIYKMSKFKNPKEEFVYHGQPGKDLPRFDFNKKLPKRVDVTKKYKAQVGLNLLPAVKILKFIPILGIVGSEKMMGAKAPKWMPTNLTRCRLDRDSDEFFVERRLNGFNPGKINLEKDASKEWQYYVRYDCSKYEVEPAGILPQVTEARFQLIDEELKVHSIEYTLQKETKTVFPSEKDWSFAKRLFRSAEFVFQEIQSHLGRTHMNMDQYAMAFYRNIVDNPIKSLLEPHFEGLISIDKNGATSILGYEGFIPQASVLTSDDVHRLLIEEVSQLSYKWTPEVIKLPDYIKNNYFDPAASAMWGIIEEYVGEFFAQNENAIKHYWSEVVGMSEDLVKHSILESTSKTLAVNNINELKQLCVYVIYHNTFVHSWVNNKQYDDGGDVEYTPFGLWDENHPSYDVKTEAKRQAKQTILMWTLSNVRYNPIMDVGPGNLKELLWQHRQEIEPGIALADLMMSIHI